MIGNYAFDGQSYIRGQGKMFNKIRKFWKKWMNKKKDKKDKNKKPKPNDIYPMW